MIKQPTAKPIYFATITEPQAYVDAALEKVKLWRDYLKEHSLDTQWLSKLCNYYGTSEDNYSSQRLSTGGTEGELTNIKINDLHSLVQNQLVVITSTRGAGVAKAINSDPRSLRNSRIGTALAEYYLSQAGYEQKFVSAVEGSLVIDETYVDLFWDKDSGEPVRPDADAQGELDPKAKPIMSGDAKMRLHMPWNVARDYNCALEAQHWNVISIVFNRFDLAAMYPKFAEQIIMASQDDVPQLKLQEKKGDETVYAHLVVHDRTPAVPNGRYSLIVGRTLVMDMDLPYPEYPVDRMSPSDVIDGPMGYCASNDVMAMEQLTDALHSIIATNNITFGGQNIVGPPLTGVTVADFAKGSRYFQVAPDMVDKIKPLQLAKSSPETYKYIEMLHGKKQEQMGSVSGTLQAQATQGASGSAMALIQAQAVQFNSGTQRAYFRLLSRVMTKLIGVLRVYADTPRVARIVGKSRAQGLKEFKYTGEDLNCISSIVYEMVNPVSQTIGGRMQMADTLIQHNLITNVKQYLTVMETGSLDALVGPDEDAQLLILEENEMLSEGKPVKVIITEHHENHIKAHMATMASPEAKDDPELTKATLDHIQEHLNVWQEASLSNPAILLATGQQPLPPSPQAQGGPGGPGGAPPPGGPGPGPGGPPPKGNPAIAAGGPGAPLEAQEPKGPNLPMNPSTHERAVVPGAQAAA